VSSKRKILESLKRKRLLEIADGEEVELPQRRALEPIRAALIAQEALTLDAVLGYMSRDELKAACRELGFDDGGRKKDEIRARIEAFASGDMPLFTSSATEEPASKKATTKKNSTKKPTTRKKAAKKAKAQGNLGFEDKLWKAADTLRGHMDPSEYKHVVLGLLFLKYVSDAFEERRERLRQQVADPASDYFIEDEKERADELPQILEDRDEYTAENVFWVPKDARWSKIQAEAKQPTIGKSIDEAMDLIGAENPKLKNVLPRVFALPGLDKHRLGKLIDVVSGIGLGTEEHRAKDTLGRVYEYFLAKFAGAEGKAGGEFFTPTCIVELLVEMLEPYKGRVFDPCCGSGGMFVQSIKFIREHGGQRDQVAIYGQESNPTTWKLAQMNLAIRGISGNLGGRHAGSFHQDLHPDLRADFVMANPPFNDSDWGGERLREDVRWKYGVPPIGNANFAWVQHFVHHLAPDGVAGFVLANGSMSSMQLGEGEIRKALVEADLVDCMVALPGQLFYGTGIPACLWFLAKDRANGRFRDRRGELLFIDARKLGRMDTRVHRVLDHADVASIASTYHAWRIEGGEYKDVAGFCKSATTEEVMTNECVLTPGRYVGAEAATADTEPFEVRVSRLVKLFRSQAAESANLSAKIEASLRSLGL
tara:strand:+ start:739 stop:2691 length:1953 start_codon:yes stop_codon:yes gene_type:complete